MRGSLISRMRRVAHSRTAAKVIAASAAGSLVVAMAASGATTAAASAPKANSMLDAALYPQTIKGASDSPSPSTGTGSTNPSTNPLSTTVGKAVSITTDASGDPTLKAFVLNTQVSGQGTGKLIVPVGTSSPTNTGGFGGLQTQGDSIVYDINSTGPNVENLHASGGLYSGTPAVSMKINAWLDGKQVSPNDLYNVTGNVKIDYVITNNTSKSTPITYVNAAGKAETTNVDIPVPFGGSFTATYGEGWGDIKAPWADTGISPTGQQLNGTAILFPPLGKAVTTLTVEGRADNATLPQSTFTAIPIDLGTIAGGAILKILPTATSAVESANGLVGSAPQKLIFYQQLLAKYAGVVSNLNTQYVQPVVKTVDGIDVTSGQINKAIDLAGKAVDLFATYIKVNQYLAAADKFAATGLASAFNEAAVLAKDLNNMLVQMETALGPIGDILKAVIDLLSNPIFQDFLIPTVLGALFSDFKFKIPIVGTEVTVNGILPGSCDMLQTTMAAWTPSGRSAFIEVAPGGASNPLVQLLDEQTQFGSSGPLTEALGRCQADSAYLDNMFKNLFDTNNGLFTLVKQLYAWLVASTDPDGFITKLQRGLIELQNELPKLAKQLDNPNSGCPTTGAAAKNQGIKSCATAQLAGLTATINQEAVDTLKNQLVPYVESFKKYSPAIVKLENQVKGLVNFIGNAVNSAPATLEKLAGDLGGVVPFTEKAGTLTASLTQTLSIVNASMIEMNKRTEAGDGVPYGNATGAGSPVTYAAWQINQNAPGKPYTADAVNLLIALVLLLIGAGVGTAMYLRRPH